MLSLPAFYTEADRARIVGKIQALTDLFSRHTLGAYSSHHRAQEEKATNRQKQLDDAQARYEAMDPGTLQVALALEAQNVKRKQDHKGHSMKPGPKVTVHQQSALGSVLAKNPDLADEYNLQVKANSGARGSLGCLGQQERRTTSQQSRTGRSRSASFMSARSSASRHSSRKSSNSIRFSRTPSQSSRTLAGRLHELGVQVARSILVIHTMVKSQKAAKASLGAEAEAQAPSPTGREKPKVAAKDGSEAFYKTAKLWIPDDTIDVWKFPFVQSQRTTLNQLALKPALDSVH